MHNKNKLTLIYLTKLILTVGLCIPLVASARKNDAPQIIFDSTSFHTNFAAISFIDQNGDAFNPGSLRGKIVLYNFIFTECTAICPKQTYDLQQVQKALPQSVRNAVHFVSVSINLKHDTPALLKAYAQHLGINTSHWSFVTSTEQQIKPLLKHLRLIQEKQNANKTLEQSHNALVWLVDKQGRLMQRYSDPIEKSRMVNELTQLHYL
jgi:protein SCO1